MIRYVAPLGEPRPLHATSIGKVHLAFMPEAEAESLLGDARLERFTEHTFTGRRALKDELDEIRERGYATNREESVAGVAAIAVPVYEGGEPGAALIAGLSVTGPADRMRDELEEMPDRLRAAARRVGAGVVTR